ncbi:hypothetical protein HN858_01620 [Candidatus Falkowbacteria bacterium]|jgi:hypothetical protein|nr:hypothetical protein [Candidatus Falkowbacteria bacterium]MBT5503769.1 hypothetical protein [Candidatus Falkowbacteria bacterium]MBT6573942.1 hypothetical protein [Candidatus Falkowbacteria bacterium]MBT7348352.1 hypothetical protein [Candidatus Falkowbacteria bacterium]MBT7500263.1 hypothetical protein [Candidatus Falkowbacteria bacterium]
MNVKAVKKSGEIRFFNPTMRDKTNGVFLLYDDGSGKLTLIIDEAGHMFHLAPFYKIKKALGFTLEQCIGGGRYRERSLRTMRQDAAWAVNNDCSLTDRERVIPPELLKQIALIITNNATWYFAS